MKNALQLFVAVTVIFLMGCRSNDSGGKGAWDDHAQLAIRTGRESLERNGVHVHPVSRLRTEFVQADGVLKGIWPYVNRQGGKVGGWWVGRCRSSGTATLAKWGDMWNRNTGTHEAHHHLEAHALCKGGHPDYMRRLAGSPDWPYFRGNFALLNATPVEGGEVVREVNVHVADEEGNRACVTYLEVDGPGALSLAEDGAVAVPVDEERVAFARSLLPTTETENEK